MRKTSLLFGVSIALLALSSFSPAASWPVYQHDVAHTGLSDAKIDPNALQFAWKAPVGYATPLVVGHSVIATKNGAGTGGPTKVSSFDLRTGKIKWMYSGDFVFPSQAAYGEGYVVFVATEPFKQYHLYVLDARTGALLYTVPIPYGLGWVMPLVAREPVTDTVRVYCANASTLICIELGTDSGSTAWTQTGPFGGFSLPTLAGNSIILASLGQYYAFDSLTGASNHFYSGGFSGPGGVAAAYDASRHQLYVLEQDSTGLSPILSAYSYIDNDNITLIWERTGSEIGTGASVAIGYAGNVYVSSVSTLSELDPATGVTQRQIFASFAIAMTPALTRGVVWAFSTTETLAYDLRSLSLLRAFPGSRGNLNSPYDSPGAWASDAFLLSYGTVYGSPGFDVYLQGR